MAVRPDRGVVAEEPLLEKLTINGFLLNSAWHINLFSVSFGFFLEIEFQSSLKFQKIITNRDLLVRSALERILFYILIVKKTFANSAVLYNNSLTIEVIS